MHAWQFFQETEQGKGKASKNWISAQSFLLLYFTGCNGSHLLCFKPSTSGTKAGACIVLQSGSAARHEKTYLYQIVAVPPKGLLENPQFIIWEIHLYLASRTFLDNLHTKLPELAEAHVRQSSHLLHLFFYIPARVLSLTTSQRCASFASSSVSLLR